MTHTPITVTAPPSLLNSRARLGMFIANLNMRRGFAGLVRLNNGLLFLSLMTMILFPDTSLGVLRPLVEDLQSGRETVVGFFAFLFLVDVCQVDRGQHPSNGILFSLSGLCLLSLVTLFYVARGILTPVALYFTWGPFLMALVGLMVVIRSYETGEGSAKRYDSAKRWMYPVLSASMGVLGIGLLWPDSPSGLFIASQWNIVVIGLTVFLLAWGCGQLRQNHLTPDAMMSRVAGMFFFAFFSAVRMIEDRNTSLMSALMSVTMCLMAVFFSFMQAQDYPTPDSSSDVE